MRFRARTVIAAACGVMTALFPETETAWAQAPQVKLDGGRARIQITASTLADAIDALGRAAGFKVSYDGPRPGMMLYNAEIDTASVPQTLFRLLEGQNVNYGVLFDKSGTKVTTLLIAGLASKTAGAGTPTPAGGRPQPFATPRTPRNDLPPVDDDPVEQPEAVEPAAEPSPSPAPPGPNQPRPQAPFSQSPFGPRPPGFERGRPSPSPSPSA